MYGIDLSILYFFNRTLASSFMDGAMDVLTNVHCWFAVYVVGGLFLIYRFRWRGVRIVIAALLLVSATDSLGHYVLKPLVNRERPCKEISNGEHVVSWIRLPVGGRGDPSFPSNHALNNFAIAMFFVIVFRKSKSVRWLFLAAFLISIGRVYEGVHYPSDIAGGAVIGIAVGYFIAEVYLAIERKMFSRA